GGFAGVVAQGAAGVLERLGVDRAVVSFAVVFSRLRPGLSRRRGWVALAAAARGLVPFVALVASGVLVFIALRLPAAVLGIRRLALRLPVVAGFPAVGLLFARLLLARLRISRFAIVRLAV